MFEGLEQAALGGVILLAAYVIQRRGWKKHHLRAKSDAHQEAKRELARQENDHRNEINRLQVKLHDFERSVDAKIETRMLQLQSLLEITDREIARLHAELDHSESSAASSRSRKAPHFIQFLRESGYTEQEAERLAQNSLPEP